MCLIGFMFLSYHIAEDYQVFFYYYLFIYFSLDTLFLLTRLLRTILNQGTLAETESQQGLSNVFLFIFSLAFIFRLVQEPDFEPMEDLFFLAYAVGKAKTA